jgi:sugar fermentation stimulation protein A
MTDERYRFPSKLIEGLILSRPNRFIMQVRIGKQIYRCHCPVTGRISHLKFVNIPCLLSRATNPERSTPYTVEAYSLDPIGRKNKRWIGINQNKANDYVAYFLEKGKLGKMLGPVTSLEREVQLGHSRIDFLVNDRIYLEVKTPVNVIPCDGHAQCVVKPAPLTSFDRMIRHFGDISKSIAKGKRAIILLCNIYPAKPFVVPKTTGREVLIKKAARKARDRGMENWQINLQLTPDGVTFLDCFQLKLDV